MQPNNPYRAPGARLESDEAEQLSPADYPKNPWLSIWTSPRQTIRQIAASDPERYIIAIAAISGIGSTLDRASLRGTGDDVSLPIILAVAIVLGPVFGVLTLYISGFLIRVTGGWLGGTARGPQVRSAIAWGGVPSMFAIVLWVPLILLVGQQAFTSEVSDAVATPVTLAAMTGIGLLDLAAALWTLVLLVLFIAEVHRFSVWRSIGSILLAVVLLVVPLMLVSVVLVATFGGIGVAA